MCRRHAADISHISSQSSACAEAQHFLFTASKLTGGLNHHTEGWLTLAGTGQRTSYYKTSIHHLEPLILFRVTGWGWGCRPAPIPADIGRRQGTVHIWSSQGWPIGTNNHSPSQSCLWTISSDPLTTFFHDFVVWEDRTHTGPGRTPDRSCPRTQVLLAVGATALTTALLCCPS